MVKIVRAKRRYRRRRYPKTTKTKKRTNITRIVKRVLHSQAENKRVYYFEQKEICPQMLSVNCFKIIPPQVQGVQQSQRSGNETMVRSLRLGITCTMLAEPYAITANEFGRSGVYFDLYIFKQREKPSYNFAIDNTDLAKFLQAGSSFNNYQGYWYNWLQTVNKDKFDCLHRSRRLMNSTAVRDNTITEQVWGQNSNATFTTTFTLTKKMVKKLKYNDNEQYPTNQALYAVVVCTRADQVQPPDILFPMGQVGFWSEMVYEDM